MLKAIYLDMDGVLVDLVRHTYRTVGIPEHLIDEAFARTTGWDAIDKVISEMHQPGFAVADLYKLWADGGQEFWASVPWTARGQELFKLCEAFAPVVLMTTPTIEPSCAAGKMEWIQRHLPFDAQRRYALSPCKHHMAHPGALLIDDGEHNITAFEKHLGQTFLWPGPWNANASMSDRDALKQLADKLMALRHA